MSSMPRVRITGPLESYAPAFVAELMRLGYATDTAACQVRLLAHLSRWVVETGRGWGPWSLQDLEAFVAVRRAEGHRVYRSMRGVGRLVDLLSSCGLIAEDAPVALTPAQKVIADWRHYLIDDRGLAAASVDTYVSAIGSFVQSHGAGGERELAGLTADEITGFLLSACEQGRLGKAKTVASAMRSLLGFSPPVDWFPRRWPERSLRWRRGS